MTAIVGIRCQDGVVIGSDSAATFGGDGRTAPRTIEQPTEHKIEILGDQVIAAGTGFVGHMQRFHDVVRQLSLGGKFSNRSDLEIGKIVCEEALKDFQRTSALQTPFPFAAMLAYPAKNGGVALCEFLSSSGLYFQPEIKRIDDLWFTSMGSGQGLTDPFLALMKKFFWSDGAPSVEGGIFTALWALQHACELNPGGIKDPIHIAVLHDDGSGYKAKRLSADDLAEHENLVDEATKHMAAFREIMKRGKAGNEVPVPETPPGT